MPDFDTFERLIRSAMVETDPTPSIDHLARIPDENRPALFKGRDRPEIREWVTRARNSLHDLFSQPPLLSTSDVNIRGSDLFERRTSTPIELKTGKVTDANIGVATMAWVMGDADDAQLKDIMSRSMTMRRDLALAREYAQVRESQQRTMERLESYLATRVTVGAMAPRLLSHFARCVARGVTTKQKAIALLELPESDWEVPVTLHAHWNKGWAQKARPFDPSEDILVQKVGRLTESPSRRKIPRAFLRVRGSLSCRTALFYPNYKNSYNRHSIRIPAKYWVQTACFHVWIDK